MPKYVGFLFKAEMIRAILAGTKTETRRVAGLDEVNFLPDDWSILKQGIDHRGRFYVHFVNKSGGQTTCYAKAAPGDVIYAKETFGLIPDDGGTVVYRATDPDWEGTENWKWKPSIFMPRALSRISLTVKSVRVERLHDITEEGAEAEGADFWFNELHPNHPEPPSSVCAFQQLWEFVNGKGSWSLNPWLFAYEWNPYKGDQ
jgi:hypothetical protein